MDSLLLSHQGNLVERILKEFWSIHTHTHTHTHSHITTIKKNKILPFATTGRDQEGTMLTEIGQTEKDKYYMLSIVFGI